MSSPWRCATVGPLPEAQLAAGVRHPLGRAYLADAIDVLKQLPEDSISLILTSPPFALIRQKAYGNVAARDYIEWFWPFAEEIHRVLSRTAASSWRSAGPGTPAARRGRCTSTNWSSACASCSTSPRTSTGSIRPACRRRPNGSPSSARGSRSR